VDRLLRVRLPALLDAERLALLSRRAVRVFTRLAVDFDALPAEDYAVEVAPDGERSHRLLGFGSGLLHAIVREAETDRLVAVLAASRLAAEGSAPAVHTWNGRDQQGRPVPPGVYEIEVRARMVPAWAEPWMREDAAYADLEGWSEAAEACTRVLRVEIVEGVEGARAALGISPLATSCATAPASYYASVDASTPAALRSTLHQVIDDHVRFPYTSSSTDTWDILNDADENPANPSTVLDLYKNTTYPDGCSTGCAWNREHTWAKSYGFQTESGSAATPTRTRITCGRRPRLQLLALEPPARRVRLRLHRVPDRRERRLRRLRPAEPRHGRLDLLHDADRRAGLGGLGPPQGRRGALDPLHGPPV
jgi:hypothetical protein